MTETARIELLHVDDEPDFADLTAEFLEQADGRFVVHTATTPDDGLDILADHDVDCVISDHNMPGWTGIEFLEAVRDRYPNLPFVLYTGKGSEEVASDAISAGVTDYLQKGTGTDQYELLANRIRNAVSARRATADADQRRHRLEQVLKTVPSCVVQLDDEGRFVFANDRGVEVLGLTESDLTDRAYNDPEWNITDLDGDPIPEPELPFRQVRDTGEPLYGFRHTIEWPDGTRKVLSVNGAPLFDADGRVESAVFSISDITDRVERERDLETTTARFEVLFENSPDMIDIHSGDGTVVGVNRRFCEVFDQPESDLVGRKVWDIDRQVDPEEIRTVWASMDVGDRHELETEFVRADGERFPVEVHLTRLPERGGDDRFMVISRDITDRRRRERELRQYRRMVDAMGETACIYDEEGRYVVVNQRLAEVYDTTTDALEGSHSDFLAEVRSQADGDPFRELLDGDRAEFRGELDAEFGDYGPAIVEYRLTPLVADGEVEGVVSVVRDITERRERERALEQARAEYEQLINGMNDAAWVSDTDGSFLEVNDAAAETTGYTRSELLSMGIDDIDPTVQGVDAARLDREEYDDGMRVFETVHEATDGERIPVEVSSSIVSYRGETAELSISRDISERKRRQRRLEEFASVVSHDLRNPLNVAQGRVELARADRVDDASDHLDQVERAHARMEALIEDLLTLARQGNTAPDVEPIELRSFVRTCWQHVATGDATLRVPGDGTIRADPGRLRRLFENLMRNSVEHATDTVTLTAGPLPDGFSVEDDGPGVPPDEREQVFEAGYSTASEGTGFGLSIVTQVAESHGWAVRLTDAHDGGARFEFTGVDTHE